DAQVYSHYRYHNGLDCDGLSGPKRVSDLPQTAPESDRLPPPQTQRHTAEMELHHCAKSVKLILSRPLDAIARRPREADVCHNALIPGQMGVERQWLPSLLQPSDLPRQERSWHPSRLPA